MTRVTVVGGGIAGMVAALECAKVGLEVILLEQEERLGGCVRAVQLRDLTLDGGAESFATRGGVVADYLTELGLADDIVPPTPDGAWIMWGDRAAAPIPKTGMLGIPGNPWATDVRAVLGWPGTVRAVLDRLLPVLRVGPATSLGQLVRTRMGRRVLDRLVAPVAVGVYSTDPDTLAVDRVAPGLNQAMTRAGCLSGGVSLLVPAHKSGTAVLGIRGGMHRLAETLAARLDHYAVDVRRGHTVHTAVPSAAGWTLTVTPPASETASDPARTGAQDTAPHPAGASAAEPATPTAPEPADAPNPAGAQTDARTTAAAPAAAESEASAADITLDTDYLIAATPRLRIADDDAPPTGTAGEVVLLLVRASELDAAPRGSGVLVAPSYPGVRAKALTHVSAKWPWIADLLPPSHHVLRLSYSAGALDDSTDPVETVLRDAATLLDVPLTRTQLVAHERVSWRDARSRATLDAPDEFARHPRLERVGSWVAGTGLAAVIPHAVVSAHRLRSEALGG